MASMITSLVTQTVTQPPTTSTAAVRAPHQGGVIEGADPSEYDPKNPIIVFIIQATIIIVFCRLLHFPLSKLRQPRVIAEIIGGILLGPTAFGRIPGFTDHIFPKESIPNLSNVANLGLILFLFLVGLEVDLRLLLRNWSIALSVGAAGMAVPFGLGCAIAYGLYHQFHKDPGLAPISFGTYMLFVGVAMAITAFPVLCRILTELNLLQDQVGVVVLSAGVGNDVVGWILLALCVSLVNAGTGISALYVFLTAVAYVLFLVYAIRPVFIWILKREGSIQNGPSQTMVGLTILLVLASAFFTGIIGVHPIFGAFLVGLICPHEGGFAIKVTEKIEDIISVFLLPLYFALSGLSTNIGLLDSGITWGYVIGVISVAFIGKIVGGTIAARLCKLVWRESFTVGVLMSCKGLVELIVLNIGYNAKILSQRTFTIFVVMALATTFATTPLTLALYPPWYRKKLAAWKRGEIDWDSNAPDNGATVDEEITIESEKASIHEIRKLLVCLRLDSLPGLFTFVSLLSGTQNREIVSKTHPTKVNKTAPIAEDKNKRPLEVHGMRLLELSDRMSSVMKESEVDDYSVRDPVVNAFHSFGRLSRVAISGEVHVVPEDAYADTVASAASSRHSDMVLIPWSEAGNTSELGMPAFADPANNTFSSGAHNTFISNFLRNAPCNSAVFVSNGFGAMPHSESKALHRVATSLSIRSHVENMTAALRDPSHHIFFPYFGGPDDRVALRFVLRLLQNPNITATILAFSGPRAHLERPGETSITSRTSRIASKIGAKKRPSDADTTMNEDISFFTTLADSVPSSCQSRVVFDTVETNSPVNDALERAKAELGQSPKNSGDIVVVGRHRAPTPAVKTELGSLLSSFAHLDASSATKQSLGDFAEAMLVGGVKAGVLVIQAAGKSLDTI